MDVRRLCIELVACVAVGSFAACSSSVNDGFAEGDGGTQDAAHIDGASHDGGFRFDGGFGDDGGFPTDAATGDSGGPAYSGYVEAISYAYTSGGQPIRGGSFGAGFVRAFPGSSCTTQHMGACDIHACTTYLDAGAISYASAGDITLTGGTQSITVSPDATGAYTFKNVMTTLWSGGETLTMRASGAEIPAFSGDVIAPTSATITVPAPPAMGQPLVIDRGLPFPISWNGAAGSTIFVQLGRASTTTQSVSVQCAFDGAAGAASIPSAALQTVSAGTNGYFSAYSRNTTPVVAGNWGVTLWAYGFALTPSGGPFSELASFR
jgi:hypothetical protein